MKKLVTVLSVLTVMSISSVVVFAQDSNDEGKDVFENTCASCHTGGFKGWLSGAPEIGEKADWEKHFENDLETLTTNVFEGTLRHEAKGDCEECTQTQIEQAIEYIISRSE